MHQNIEIHNSLSELFYEHSHTNILQQLCEKVVANYETDKWIIYKKSDVVQSRQDYVMNIDCCRADAFLVKNIRIIALEHSWSLIPVNFSINSIEILGKKQEIPSRDVFQKFVEVDWDIFGGGWLNEDPEKQKETLNIHVKNLHTKPGYFYVMLQGYGMPASKIGAPIWEEVKEEIPEKQTKQREEKTIAVKKSGSTRRRLTGKK